jgi:ribosomal protein S18 acetylase RimI-like enzyme
MADNPPMRGDPTLALISVRALCTTDIQPIRMLSRQLRRYFSPIDLREMDDLLARAPSGLVALQSSGEMLGFLLDSPTGDPLVREIAWMAVAAAWQNRGIGSLLLREACASFIRQGVVAVEVCTVAASSGYHPYDATRAFYYRRGFRDVRIDPDYYWPGGDRLVLRHDLAAPPAN